jgi:hypothetical protein
MSGHRCLPTARRSASSGAAASMTRNPTFCRPQRNHPRRIRDLCRAQSTRRANRFGFSEIVSSPGIEKNQKYFASAIGQIRGTSIASCPGKRGVGHRHERGTGSGGRGCAFDERRGCVRRSRVVLTPRRWRQVGGKYPADDGDNKADHREERAISRKAIAQGMSDCLRCPVCSCAHFFVHIAHETAGAARIRHSLRPLFSRGGIDLANLGQIVPRERRCISVR